ncbi:cell division protein ZapE [Legionella saoudiensis]|uniref:cell division protein ZapE n=1 Tax=Legionella saoudiensis TaxID=1750561 RepID=UPI00072FF88C|nr:cell division protein ZapE [Legionella saoudiensis]
MTLTAYYDAAIERGEINDDPLQRDILAHMERLANDLEKANTSWFSWIRKPHIQGLYIYGPVGAGKTYLVDLFYDHIAESQKARFHFHHFMQQVDAQLRRLQGQKDPLQHVAKKLSKSIRVLCFDEFLVHDVAYAMILAELLQALIAHGVILVISSNTKPDDLYKNGVHRKRFLPAITAINKNCQVLNLNELRDYRVGREPLVDAYLFPLSPQTQEKMKQQFLSLATPTQGPGEILIQNRDIPYLERGDKSIWFDFNVVCNLPRSQLDYLELADKFDSIFISGVPELTENHTLQTIMFIHFIDVMYDRGVNIIISAAVPIEQLYLKGELLEMFKRTRSRLMEMQSVDYLSRHPKREVQEMG